MKIRMMGVALVCVAALAGFDADVPAASAMTVIINL